MLKIKFKLYAFLREVANAKEIEIEVLDNITLREALEHLIERSGEKLRKYLFKDDGKVRDSLIFVVNGESLRGEEAENFVLMGSSQIAIFPPFSGGRI